MIRIDTRFWRRFARNRPAIFGLVTVVLLTAVAVLAPQLARFPPLQTAVAPPLRPPSAEYLMGTDDLGRDGYSTIVYGARTSLYVGAVAGAIAMGLGLLIGIVSGFWSGRVDAITMRVLEAFQVLPIFFVMILVASLFGTSLFLTSCVIGLLAWPKVARLVRAEVISMREVEFVAAATALGNSRVRIAFRHILPNVLATGLTASSLEVANAILLEAGLSFLGLGDPSAASWGAMLNNARQFVSSAWWMAVFPGAAIALTVLGFNLTAEGLTDALNPKGKRR